MASTTELTSWSNAPNWAALLLLLLLLLVGPRVLADLDLALLAGATPVDFLETGSVFLIGLMLAGADAADAADGTGAADVAKTDKVG
jgi:hypothetical protein